MEGWSVVLIKDADIYVIFLPDGGFNAVNHISRGPVNFFDFPSEPIMGIDLVKSDAGLKDFNQRKTRVFNPQSDQFADLRNVAGKTAGHKTGLMGYS